MNCCSASNAALLIWIRSVDTQNFKDLSAKLCCYEINLRNEFKCARTTTRCTTCETVLNERPLIWIRWTLVPRTSDVSIWVVVCVSLYVSTDGKLQETWWAIAMVMAFSITHWHSKIITRICCFAALVPYCWHIHLKLTKEDTGSSMKLAGYVLGFLKECVSPFVKHARIERQATKMS